MHANEMKRLFRIFDLSKHEQRVVLIVILVLIALAFVGYEQRVHRVKVQPTSTSEANRSASPVQSTDEQ